MYGTVRGSVRLVEGVVLLCLEEVETLFVFVFFSGPIRSWLTALGSVCLFFQGVVSLLSRLNAHSFCCCTLSANQKLVDRPGRLLEFRRNLNRLFDPPRLQQKRTYVCSCGSRFGSPLVNLPVI